ncbi:MAG: pyruvate kinase [Oscillospiraceae bacterium]|nr:pyruvate kinase [Oscillospiraceae bacterium]
MRKTKIVCTIGPATSDESMLRELMLAGMDVARINFSHGTHEAAKIMVDKIKKVRKELNLPVAILLDTKGPEIRLKKFKDGKVTLKEGQTFTLCTGDVEGDENQVSITYSDLTDDVAVGTRILIDDGLIELAVTSVKNDKIVCIVNNGGTISDNKGVNVPNVELSMPYMSEKDKSDILFGIEQDFDFIAASFCRTAEDVLEIKQLLERNGGRDINIIAKIENKQGVDNIDEILYIADGIMVARGDMGVEIDMQELPVIQKKLIKKTYRTGKRVITATQMLDSMIRNPRPTRAEVSDVANAIYDGTSAIMLSGETAMGKYPIEAVKTMASIAEQTERDIDYIQRLKNRDFTSGFDVTNAISHATCTTAHDLKAAAIIALTYSGGTARQISRFRPDCPIIAPTISEKARRQLNLSWGVIPVASSVCANSDELFDKAVDDAEKLSLVKNGDLVVITGGVPLGVAGTTNIMKVQLVGHILVKGTGLTAVEARGHVLVARGRAELFSAFNDGDLVVIDRVTTEMIVVLRNASGIVVESADNIDELKILAMALDIPIIVGAAGATKILKSGTMVTVDAASGIVYAGTKDNN